MGSSLPGRRVLYVHALRQRLAACGAEAIRAGEHDPPLAEAQYFRNSLRQHHQLILPATACLMKPMLYPPPHPHFVNFVMRHTDGRLRIQIGTDAGDQVSRPDCRML